MGGVQAVLQGQGFGLIDVGLGLLLGQSGAQLGQLLVQAVPFRLSVRLGAVQLLGEQDHPRFHDAGIVFGIFQRGADGGQIRFQSGGLRIQRCLIQPGLGQKLRQGGGLGFVALGLGLLLGQESLQLIHQRGLAGVLRGDVRFGALQLAGELLHQVFHHLGFGAGLLQRAVHGIHFRLERRDLGLQGFPVGTGGLAFQGGLQLRHLGGQAVLFLLGVRFQALGLLGEDDHPLFHDAGIVFRLLQGGGGGLRAALQGGDLLIQGRFFRHGLIQARFQGGGFGLIGFRPGLLLRLGGGQLRDLGGQAVLFLLGVRFQAVGLLGEGGDLLLQRLLFASGVFQGGVHGGDVRFQRGDALGQRVLFTHGGGQALRQAVGAGLIIGVLGLLRVQRGLQLRKLGGQGVLFLVRRVQRRLHFVDAALQRGVVRLHLIHFRGVAGLFIQRGVQRLDGALCAGQLGVQLFGFVLPGRFFLGAGLQGGFGVAQLFLQLRPLLVAERQRLVQGLVFLLQRVDLLLHFFRCQHIPFGGGTRVRRGTVRLQAGADQYAAGYQRDAYHCQDHDHPFFLHQLRSPFSVLPLSPEQDKKPLFLFSSG